VPVLECEYGINGRQYALKVNKLLSGSAELQNESGEDDGG
jgi:hypothetical protein